MARIMNPEPTMEIYDPCCGSAGLLIKCELVLNARMQEAGKKTFAPLRLHGQEYIAERLKTDIYGNRDLLTYLRNQRKFYRRSP